MVLLSVSWFRHVREDIIFGGKSLASERAENGRSPRVLVNQSYFFSFGA